VVDASSHRSTAALVRSHVRPTFHPGRSPRWKRSYHTLYSRQNDKRRGAIVIVIVIVMQRLYEDDLVGHVHTQELREVVRFPAIAEADEVHGRRDWKFESCFLQRRVCKLSVPYG
jgi:hypothetical protein